jgi:hypothetical protein
MTAVVASLSPGLKSRRLLGYAGLLPFAGCLALMLLAGDRNVQALAASQMLNYAGLIASFLGAVHWGAAMYGGQGPQSTRLAWGVIPALIAWPLLNLPQDIAFAGFAALYGVILLVDYYLLPLLDDDYRRLRLRLSAVVIACLLTAAATAPGVAT